MPSRSAFRWCDSSDESLQVQVDRALRESGYPELRQVRVMVEDGSVHLSGAVSRYYLKQIAQSAVHAVVQGERLTNALTVL